MPRNRSETRPQVLHRKRAKPARWSEDTEVRVTRLLDGGYWVSADSQDDPRRPWVASAADLAQAKATFDAMVDGFWFDEIGVTPFREILDWEGSDAT